MTLNALYEVILAAKYGSIIQYRPFNHSADWQDIPDVWTWDWSGAEYRIKPQEDNQ